MDQDKQQMDELESLKLITDMIQKAKKSQHETGVSPLLWGTSVFIASFVSYLQIEFDFRLPFDISLIVLFAIIPQVFITIKEAKNRKFRSHQDVAIDAVWITYAITLFGFIAYANIAPSVVNKAIGDEGWQLMKHSITGIKADELIRPFTPSITSLFILIYAFPTLATGIIHRFKPMLIGAFITYGLFISSLFTTSKYDMLFSAITALVCWFIPGIILRRRYLRQKEVNV